MGGRTTHYHLDLLVEAGRREVLLEQLDIKFLVKLVGNGEPDRVFRLEVVQFFLHGVLAPRLDGDERDLDNSIL